MITNLPFDSSDANNNKEYGPGNPEPGGDGTKGEDTKEIVNLISSRLGLTSPLGWLCKHIILDAEDK